MYHSMQSNYTSKENAYQQEWAYVKGRGFTLNLLAIGSLVVTFRLGGFIGNMVSSGSTTIFCIRAVFMWLAYMAVDWVLKNSLAAASNVEKGEKATPTPKSVILFAVTALLTTLGLSIASNPFISNELAGESYLPQFNQEIVAAIQRDSSLKVQAFSAIKDASKEQDKKIKASYNQKKVLVREAVAEGSASCKGIINFTKIILKRGSGLVKNAPKNTKPIEKIFVQQSWKETSLSLMRKDIVLQSNLHYPLH